jgi:hypothetical protein
MLPVPWLRGLRKHRARDEKATEADHLLHRRHGFPHSVAILEVAIASGAAATLGRNRLVRLLVVLSSAMGIAPFACSFFS